MVVRDIRMLFIAVGSGTEGGHFDNFPAKPNMCQPKPAPDEPAVGEQRPYFLRMRVGRNIEVLGMQLKQCVPDAAADKERLETRFIQPIQYLERAI